MPVAAWVEWLPLVACGCLCSVVAYGCLYRYRYRYIYKYKSRYRYISPYSFLTRLLKTLLLCFFAGIIRL